MGTIFIFQFPNFSGLFEGNSRMNSKENVKNINILNASLNFISVNFQFVGLERVVSCKLSIKFKKICQRWENEMELTGKIKSVIETSFTNIINSWKSEHRWLIRIQLKSEEMKLMNRMEVDGTLYFALMSLGT